MKKIFIFLSGALFILSSCGISSRYSSSDSGQKFSDGIYSSAPSRKDKQQEQISKTELQALAEAPGLYEAMNLDGGGSSTLWTSTDGVLNHPCDNKTFDNKGERIVPNILIVK